MVRAGFSALKAADAPALSKAFNACTPILPSQRGYVENTLIGQITTALACAAESAYPLAISPVVANCKAIAKHTGAASLAPIVVPAGSCLNISHLDVDASAPMLRAAAAAAAAAASVPASASPSASPSATATLAQLKHFGLAVASGDVARPSLTGAQTAAMSWYYLACTEIIHPIAADNITVSQSTHWSARMCSCSPIGVSARL